MQEVYRTELDPDNRVEGHAARSGNPGREAREMPAARPLGSNYGEPAVALAEPSGAVSGGRAARARGGGWQSGRARPPCAGKNRDATERGPDSLEQAARSAAWPEPPLAEVVLAPASGL